MKPGGVSTLNPYAAAYIPLSKRGVDEKADVPAIYEKASLVPEPSRMSGFYGSSSSSKRQQQQQSVVDEELDMALEYLQMAFPGVSNESLTGVYMANRGDLDATVDMLTQLEFDSFESSENLPDTLDIWGVSEPASSTAECSTVKQKSEVGAASSDSTASSKVVIT